MAKLSKCSGVVGATFFLFFAAGQAAEADGLDCFKAFNCTLYGPCHLPCLDPAPQASAAAMPGAARGEAREAPRAAQPRFARRAAADTRAPHRGPPTAKPVVTVGARELDVGHLAALATIVPDQTVQILPAAATTVAAAPTDMVVTVQADAAVRQRAGRAPAVRLFTEQVHVIAGPAVATMRDLAGKPVSFGPAGSSGQDVARRLFQAMRLPVEETPLDLANALDGVATGDVAALVVLSPVPYAPLEKLAGSDLHLLALPADTVLPEGLVAAEVIPRDYPGISSQEPVRTAAVSAVLSLSDKGAKAPSAKRLLAALSENAASLSKRGFDLLRADAATGRSRFAQMARP